MVAAVCTWFDYVVAMCCRFDHCGGDVHLV